MNSQNNATDMALGGIGCIVITIIYLVQLAAMVGGFVEWTDSVFFGVLLSIILDFIPIIGTIAGIYYATTIWDWNIVLAIMFFCLPLVLGVFSGSLALLLALPAIVWEYIKKIFK